MATRSVIAKPPVSDYSHIELLPDPPQVPDMEQFDGIHEGEYRSIEIVRESETRHWGYSEVLGLEIWWYEGLLRLRDPVTGEFLHATPEESEEAIEAAGQRAESAEARMAEMKSELRRLRGE